VLCLKRGDDGALRPEAWQRHPLGPQWDAMKESNRIRRENAKREIRDELARATAKITRTPIEQSLDESLTNT
jgi:hypothetical protein